MVFPRFSYGFPMVFLFSCRFCTSGRFHAFHRRPGGRERPEATLATSTADGSGVSRRLGKMAEEFHGGHGEPSIDHW